MPEKKSILLISYYFPPNNSVGSRRWAKYSKVLSRNGIQVHVLCAKSNSSESSPWDDDIEGLNINYLPSKYPRVLDNWKSESIFYRIRYKICDKLISALIIGSHYDRSIFWKSTMIKSAKKLIVDNQIDQIIVSTPPNRSSYYAAQLKDEFPKLRLIVDFRDPWTWGEFREYPNLKGSNRFKEEEMNKFVIEKADEIIVSVDNMKRKIEKKYNFRKTCLCFAGRNRHG